jgi:hypothetical protein
MAHDMTLEQVEETVRAHASDKLTETNDHRLTLGQALLPPRRISVIERKVQDRQVTDHELSVWLVGGESHEDGYKIVMRDDGMQFGLASKGFPDDDFPVLCGWYGGLVAAFLSM